LKAAVAEMSRDLLELSPPPRISFHCSPADGRTNDIGFKIGGITTKVVWMPPGLAQTKASVMSSIL
jgi:hypothetical protein